MNTVYRAVVDNLYNGFARAWKESGKRIIGYTCSYVPEEVFHAAGMLPFRLGGMSATAHDISDAYFGPFICSLPKSIQQAAGEGIFKFLDGIIMTPACDSMRRMDECWRKADADIHGILPSFFFHYAVPHKAADYSLTWLEDETRRLIKGQEDHFGVRITEASLRTAVPEPRIVSEDDRSIPGEAERPETEGKEGRGGRGHSSEHPVLRPARVREQHLRAGPRGHRHSVPEARAGIRSPVRLGQDKPEGQRVPRDARRERRCAA